MGSNYGNNLFIRAEGRLQLTLRRICNLGILCTTIPILVGTYTDT
uniref:Uncharacterized protein n=1 Tax=Rhizophora mucronata TaxID=61149 RepID=A0A2P2M094_RHIMU